MKTIINFISLLAVAYIILIAILYLLQRNLLYFPVPARDGIPRDEITIMNDDLSLHGWILNQGQQKALVYFGGNAEDITDNINQLETLFSNYTIYLINYRGYGKNRGKPSEQGLFSDAIAIYDQIRDKHHSISLMGRSLGSGVAIYLASKRDIERLFLLTPYDSIAEVAQTHYPFFPTRHLVRDRFDSTAYAQNISAPTLIVTAEFDQVVPLIHSQRLRDLLTQTSVSYYRVAGAEHNNLTSFPRYLEVLQAFIGASN